MIDTIYRDSDNVELAFAISNTWMYGVNVTLQNISGGS